MNVEDVGEHLETLGLDPGVQHTPEGVKKAWRKKCGEHHPDKGGDPQKFMAVTHAYKMLTDPSYRHQEERKTHPEKPDLNIRMQVPVSFEEAFFGREINVSYNRVEVGADFKPVIKEEQEILYVHFQLPRGCFDGHEVREKGYGLKHGDEVGDLMIRVVPMAHPKFKVKQADIISEEQVPLDLMLKGGELEVQTMYGLRTLKVPAGTPPSARLTIKKCGVGGFGNHIVVVTPVFPDKNALKSEAWKGLDINWSIAPEQEAEDSMFEEIFVRLNNTNFKFSGR